MLYSGKLVMEADMAGWKKVWAGVLALILSAGLAAGCKGRGQGTPGSQAGEDVRGEISAERLKVVTTLFPYYDFTAIPLSPHRQICEGFRRQIF